MQVADADLQDLYDDEYYYHDIVGLTVINNEDNSELGSVKEILQLPANDVWVVGSKGKDDLYLPFTEQVVTEIDLEAKTAHVNLLEEV